MIRTLFHLLKILLLQMIDSMSLQYNHTVSAIAYDSFAGGIDPNLVEEL